MSIRKRQRAPRSYRHALLALSTGSLVCCMLGCGTKDEGIGKLVPVAGNVTLDGQPLTTGSVSFRPDAEKGNKSQHYPMSQLDAQGNYRLTTVNHTGAPLGWYKVIITAQDESEMMKGKGGGSVAQAKSLINMKYSDPGTTNLTIEVVESPNPGAYDLKLSK